MKLRCPTCGTHDDVADDFRWRPFCSRRCKMIDLGNWLDEVYRISRPLTADDLGEAPMSVGALQYLRPAQAD